MDLYLVAGIVWWSALCASLISVTRLSPGTPVEGPTGVIQGTMTLLSMYAIAVRLGLLTAYVMLRAELWSVRSLGFVGLASEQAYSRRKTIEAVAVAAFAFLVTYAMTTTRFWPLLHQHLHY